MKRTETETYQAIINKEGEKHQALICCGELAELSAELSRYFNQTRKNDEKVIDEIADVYITLNQMMLIFDSEKIDNRIKYKLDRLNKIIDGEIVYKNITTE